MERSVMSGVRDTSVVAKKFGTTPRLVRILIVVGIVVAVSVAASINPPTGAGRADDQIDRLTSEADRIATAARIKAFAVNDLLNERTFAGERAKLTAEADDAARLFFEANEAFGGAVAEALKAWRATNSAAARRSST